MRSIFFLNLLITLTIFFSLTDLACAQHKSKTSKQVKLLLKEKNSRTLTEQKIDSRLLQAMREYNGEKMAKGLELEPAHVNADKKGNLDVDISADVSDALIARIKNLGGKIIYPSVEYHTIRANINLSMVEIIAGYTEVKFIGPAAVAMLNNNMAPIKN